MNNTLFTALAVLIISVSTTLPQAKAQGTSADYARAQQISGQYRNTVFRDKVTPHWVDDHQFWYRVELKDGQQDYLWVDAKAGTRESLFDLPELATELSKNSGKDITAGKIKLDKIFRDKETGLITFKEKSQIYEWDNAKSSLKSIEKHSFQEQKTTGYSNQRFGQRPQHKSPDGRYEAFTRDFNLYLRDLDEQEEIPLTTDATEEHYYTDRVYWSPDSSHLMALKTRKGETHTVYLVESSPKDQVQPKLLQHNYLKPGDEIALIKPHLFRPDWHAEVKIDDTLFENPWSIKQIRWAEDSSQFTFLYNQRGHQTMRVVAVDAKTGNVKAIIDETTDSFIEYNYKTWAYYLDDTHEILWASERDGWNHLYLIDANTGEVKNQITKGDWIVRNVEYVDIANRRILFRCSGIYAEQDPYYSHYAWINFDGTNLIKLTAGNGTHEIEYSPNKDYCIVRYSRVDKAPTTELRSMKTGELICTLEEADTSKLEKTGWKPPQRFAAKARDGKTDIYGVIWRPSNFDASKTYPVIEKIYAGPHGSFVPKSFRTVHSVQQLVELGFIVVQCDGMGTSNRSKAFQAVSHKNLGDSGFPDRILWMQAAAKQHPEMDISNVGIYGGSAGGQSSLRALLAFGDFYKVAVSDCGCHDNRMDKIWWNEQYVGWPIGPHYDEQSNVTNAHKLEGKLMLVVGELDKNVDPASTMQVVNALVKANKDFDLIVMPGVGHGAMGTRYAKRRAYDFFVRNILKVEPRGKEN